MNDAPTSDQEIEKLWTQLSIVRPPKPGYYKVRDLELREGKAFMHANHRWTNIEGPVRRPIIDWKEIR